MGVRQGKVNIVFFPEKKDELELQCQEVRPGCNVNIMQIWEKENSINLKFFIRSSTVI